MHGMRRELKPIKGDGEIGDEARQAMKEERERILRLPHLNHPTPAMCMHLRSASPRCAKV